MSGGTMIKGETFASIVVLLIATVPILMVHSGAAHQQVPAAATGVEANLAYPIFSGNSLVGSSFAVHGLESRLVTPDRFLMQGVRRRRLNSCWLGDGSCGSELTCCNNVGCVNTETDGSHCGGCNSPCAWDNICCNSVCTNIWSTDAFNCGACGKWCGWKGAICNKGICNYNS